MTAINSATNVDSIKKLVSRAIQDDSTEGDNAIRLLRQMVAKDHDFRPEERIIVMSASESGRWSSAQRLLEQTDQRLHASRRYAVALENELQTVLSNSLIEKLKKKAVKASQTRQDV